MKGFIVALIALATICSAHEPKYQEVILPEKITATLTTRPAIFLGDPVGVTLTIRNEGDAYFVLIDPSFDNFSTTSFSVQYELEGFGKIKFPMAFNDWVESTNPAEIATTILAQSQAVVFHFSLMHDNADLHWLFDKPGKYNVKCKLEFTSERPPPSVKLNLKADARNAWTVPYTTDRHVFWSTVASFEVKELETDLDKKAYAALRQLTRTAQLIYSPEVFDNDSDRLQELESFKRDFPDSRFEKHISLLESYVQFMHATQKNEKDAVVMATKKCEIIAQDDNHPLSIKAKELLKDKIKQAYDYWKEWGSREDKNGRLIPFIERYNLVPPLPENTAPEEIRAEIEKIVHRAWLHIRKGEVDEFMQLLSDDFTAFPEISRNVFRDSVRGRGVLLSRVVPDTEVIDAKVNRIIANINGIYVYLELPAAWLDTKGNKTRWLEKELWKFKQIDGNWKVYEIYGRLNDFNSIHEWVKR